MTTWESTFDSQQGQQIFLFSRASRPALRPTQPPIQWVPGSLPPAVKRPGRESDTHLYQVPKLRIHGAILQLLNTSLCNRAPLRAWKSVQKLAHAFSYSRNLDYVTLETKPIVTRWAIVGYHIPNTSETRPAGKAGFSRRQISRLGSQCAYRYFPEGTACGVPFGENVSIN
jgi:hypothetical protein